MNEGYTNVPNNQSVGVTNEQAPLSATEIAGIDTNGHLQPLLVDSGGNLKTTTVGIVSGTFTPSGLTVKGVVTMVTLTNSSWTLLPPSPLALRNNIMIQNPSVSGYDLIYNYDNTQPLTSGVHIAPGTAISIAIRGSIPVYGAVAGAATIVAPVEELE